MQIVNTINTILSEKINRFFHPESSNLYPQKEVQIVILQGFGLNIEQPETYNLDDAFQAAKFYSWYENSHPFYDTDLESLGQCITVWKNAPLAPTPYYVGCETCVGCKAPEWASQGFSDTLTEEW